MKTCCVCNRRVWSWQQSQISFSPIHLKCHREMLSKTLEENPSMRAMYAAEVSEFEMATGTTTNVLEAKQ